MGRSGRVYACTLVLLVMASLLTPGAGALAASAVRPAPVRSLRATHVTVSSVSLAWRNPTAATLRAVVVRYAKGGTAPAGPTRGHAAGRVLLPTHTLVVRRLARATTYSFAAFTLSGRGHYSRATTVTAKTAERRLTGVRTVVTNSLTACALLAHGRAACWGYNVDHELGNGSPLGFSNLPVAVRGVGGHGVLSGLTSLATSGGGFCGVTTSATLVCWGDNSGGALGIGSNAPSPYPVAVKGIGGHGSLTGVRAVVGGLFSFCALLTSQRVVCWGDNRYGELGTGFSLPSVNTVQPVLGVAGTGRLGGVAGLSANGTTICAVLVSTAVDCWGGAPLPALGDGTNDSSNVPVQVVGVGGTGLLAGVSRLSPQGGVTCALLSSGAVDCWGYGYLGDGSGSGSLVPVRVAGVGGVGTLGGVGDLVGDGSTTCARLTSGGVDCWGFNNESQVGAPTPGGGPGLVPVRVLGEQGQGHLGGVVRLATNMGAVCAVLASARVDCWGDNTGSQLGDGRLVGPETCDGRACSTVPAPVVGPTRRGALTGVRLLVSDSANRVGGFGFYTVLSSGGVDYWGAGTNAQGLLGLNTYQDNRGYNHPSLL